MGYTPFLIGYIFFIRTSKKKVKMHNFRMVHLGFHHVFNPVLITFREAYYLCWLSHIRIYSLLSFERKMTHPDLILWLEFEKNDKKMGKNLDKKWTIFFSSRF